MHVHSNNVIAWTIHSQETGLKRIALIFWLHLRRYFKEFKDVSQLHYWRYYLKVESNFKLCLGKKLTMIFTNVFFFVESSDCTWFLSNFGLFRFVFYLFPILLYEILTKSKLYYEDFLWLGYQQATDFQIRHYRKEAALLTRYWGMSFLKTPSQLTEQLETSPLLLRAAECLDVWKYHTHSHK